MNLCNVYWDWNAMQADHRMPSILAIGDSWFWYPLPGGSLINQLGKLVDKKEHAILALGNNGAEVYDYVYGKYNTAISYALQMHGPALSAVFISGGGNDFAGFADLRPMLQPDCATATGPEQCFFAADEHGTLPWLMRKTGESLNILLDEIFAAGDARLKVFLHNYDYAIPTGKGVFGRDGSWLKPALDFCRVPEALQGKCMAYLINCFTAMLEDIALQYPGRVIVVDSRGTLQPDDWANELHPKGKGFKKIAVDRWLPKLVEQGLA